jgi:hypothetical protein
MERVNSLNLLYERPLTPNFGGQDSFYSYSPQDWGAGGHKGYFTGDKILTFHGMWKTSLQTSLLQGERL